MEGLLTCPVIGLFAKTLFAPAWRQLSSSVGNGILFCNGFCLSAESSV